MRPGSRTASGSTATRRCPCCAGNYVPSPDLPNSRPETALYLVADDMARLRSRIGQMLGRFAWAENPPSRTRRLVGNVRLRGSEGNALRISANFAVYRMRHELV